MSETKIMIMNIPALKEHYHTIVNQLNRSCYSGAYNMDESFELKVACDNILASINTLDNLQTAYIQKIQTMNTE